jgi:putative ABC transport system permease protein
LRELEFEEIGLNFEIIAEPGYLDDVFQLRLATLHLPEGNATALQNRIVAEYPNITFIGLGDIVDRVTSQIGRIGWGIRMLGLFIVGAAVAVLAGTIGIDSSRRGREVALLKTIGMTRRQVAGLFAVEYALIGLVAAVVGVVGGAVVSGLLITRAFETEYTWPIGFIVLAVAAGVAVSVFAGFVASGGALQRRPIEVLRHQE